MRLVKCGEALSHFENFLEDVLRLKASQKVKSKFDFCLNVGQAGSWAGFLPSAASASASACLPWSVQVRSCGLPFSSGLPCSLPQAGVHVLD